MESFYKDAIRSYMFKNYLETAPTIKEINKYFVEEIGIKKPEKDKIIKALKDIGEELSKKGYQIKFNDNCQTDDCRVYEIKRYPGERMLTEEERKRIAKYVIDKMGEKDARVYSNNFDFRTDGLLVWVNGYKEGKDAKLWHWNQIPIVIDYDSKELDDGGIDIFRF